SGSRGSTMHHIDQTLKEQKVRRDGTDARTDNHAVEGLLSEPRGNEVFGRVAEVRKTEFRFVPQSAKLCLVRFKTGSNFLGVPAWNHAAGDRARLKPNPQHPRPRHRILQGLTAEVGRRQHSCLWPNLALSSNSPP